MPYGYFSDFFLVAGWLDSVFVMIFRSASQLLLPFNVSSSRLFDIFHIFQAGLHSEKSATNSLGCAPFFSQ
jgi:hypothetical protein